MARTGRPRTFDRDEGVRQAMHLFWEHGYGTTSLARLLAAIGGGINAPSFYAAFGSKEALFKEGLAKYVETHGRVTAPLFDAALPPREAVERTLRGSARMQTEPGHPRGCLLVATANGCGADEAELAGLLAAERARTAEGFRACVERGVASGELPGDTGAAALACALQTFLLGLTSQARDGASFETLDAAISAVMALWDRTAAAARPSRPN